MQKTLSSVAEDVPELILPQGMFNFLLASGCLNTVAEHCQKYYHTLRLRMDYELIWPLPTHAQSYE
jgi:hypothetical protein